MACLFTKETTMQWRVILLILTSTYVAYRMLVSMSLGTTVALLCVNLPNTCSNRANILSMVGTAYLLTFSDPAWLGCVIVTLGCSDVSPSITQLKSGVRDHIQYADVFAIDRLL
uniref:Uncharacterized protein n=1 Tax=Ananas comosus var. bracteatus TaxID=296719 RepID=A0A6V7PAB7_ANACO|nr:unnamed protein product [Ananas comosus var. bracteatus]